MYAGLSGLAGVEPDWAQLRNLYHPQARLIPTVCRADGTLSHQCMTFDMYVESRGEYLRTHAFYERETSRRSYLHPTAAQLLSEYETRVDARGPVVARGVNSIHLLRVNARWWITTVLWDVSVPALRDAAPQMSQSE